MKTISSLFLAVLAVLILPSCKGCSSGDKKGTLTDSLAVIMNGADDFPVPDFETVMFVSPENPRSGDIFRVISVGGKEIKSATINVAGPSGELRVSKTRAGIGLPYWRVDEFVAAAAGEYKVELKTDKGVENQVFTTSDKPQRPNSSTVWKTMHGWNSKMELLYSAWVNALFCNADERSSWGALHEVTQNKEWNFLHDHLSLGEDGAENKISVRMGPDCADNPYFLRAYFSWKLGLPFGFHEADRGALGRAPNLGRWITNETASSQANPVLKFNSFMRTVMNGVHSGTARAAMDNVNADYYPVSLTRESLRPGVVFADPYGHTLVLVNQLPQIDNRPGTLLSVDAQPDGTVAIKRFWKGNFLFETSGVIGQPGFKAFRPIAFDNGKARLIAFDELVDGSGFVAYSLQQRGMAAADFYAAMERVVNPKPLDPETALMDLVKALHEQLMTRVNSVDNGEKYMKAHPGTVIPMPGSAAGVFQTGGVWEDFSTPNRDLRLLIAMDEVLGFPEKVMRLPGNYRIPRGHSPEQVKKDIEVLLDKQLAELTIAYTRGDGSKQTLTLAEILARRDAFEMAYNPNDGAEIRWGAPEHSNERSTCRRQVPANQMERMKVVRVWFSKRLHPPT